MWEFPGGKLEPGEEPPEALIREIEEELSCRIKVGTEIVRTCHEYDFATIVLTTYYCEIITGAPEASEHSELRWMAPADLHTLDWAPADIPAVAQIQLDFAR